MREHLLHLTAILIKPASYQLEIINDLQEEVAQEKKPLRESTSVSKYSDKRQGINDD